MERRCESGSPGAPGASRATRGDDSPSEGGRGRVLRCDACSLVITRGDQRVEIADAHRHTFVNPHGLVFEIGCFGRAPGCVGVGPAEAFFSWFPGYAWRVVVCRGCGTHLGWSYGERPDFYGLVLDRLREDDERPS